ncbi:hypothetical protein R1flu_005145 [Riccia fluitans]|uniref:Ubiquitin carboxyl-terminal hydrolase n=1 Tax=Riccia fluitans TaxID=41844 RepID=A0ABD1YSV2_9MARC
MAAAKRPDLGLGMPGASWTQRRIAFHASSTYSSAPAMEPLNDPLLPNGNGGGIGAAAGSGAGDSSLANKMIMQNAQNSQRLPSSMPLQWPTAQKIGAGLSNLGNTCFLNSVLQCLTYTPPLAGYLQSGQHKMSCRVAGFCAFCALQEHVSQALTSAGRVVAPNKLAKNLRSISRSFRMCRQEDAHEYMRYLLEALHKCCIPSELTSSSSTSSKPSQDRSLVYKIFGGRLRSQVKCSVCSHCSNTYDPFLDLSLEIVRADSLTKALTRFTAVDTLDGENKYRCAHCKKKVRAQKQFTIETVPNILTIQFKRFSGTVGGKIDKKVDFETTLDMKPFCCSQESSLKYRLYGVLVHSGWSTHSGHYYCFIRTSSDIWHVLDDSRVRQVSEKTVLEQKAYMLFYVREVKKEAISSGQVALKPVPSPARVTVPTPAPTPAPGVIPAPSDIKRVPEPVKGPSPLRNTTASAESLKAPSQLTEVVRVKDVAPPEPEIVSEPPRLEAELSTDKMVAPCSQSSPSDRHGVKKDEEKSDQADTCCTTSECEPEADWDEHYKNGMNVAMTSSQNMLKLLRAMPRTRRYFMARAMQKASRTLSAHSSHVGTLDPSVSVAKKEGKRRLSLNGDVPGSKRHRREASEDKASVSQKSNLPSEKVKPLKLLEHKDRSIHKEEEKSIPVEARSVRIVANGSASSHAENSDGGICHTNLSMGKLVEHGDGENGHGSVAHNHVKPVDRRESQHSGAELRGEKREENGCQPMDIENGGLREHVVGSGTVNENPAKPMKVSGMLDRLYGVGVPRWNEDEVGEKEVDKLLREAGKPSTFKPQDIWDAEYDKGRTKKVRNKFVGDSSGDEPMNERGNGSLKFENLFQAFGNSKVGNGFGNGRRLSNGNGHISVDGFKVGKNLTQ